MPFKNSHTIIFIIFVGAILACTHQKGQKTSFFDSSQYYFYALNKPSKAISAADSCLRDYKGLEIENQECFQCYMSKIVALGRLGQFDSVFVMLKRAEFKADKLNLLSQKAHILLLTGASYVDQEKTDEALDYFNQALTLFNELGETFNIALINQFSGFVYSARNQIVKSQEKLLKAFITFKKLNATRQLGITSTYLAGNFKNLNDLKAAKKFNKMAIQLALEMDDTLGLIAAYNSYGLIYKEQNIDTTKHYFLKSLELSSKDSTNINNITLHFNLARLFMSTQDLQRANFHLKKVEKLSQKLNYIPGLIRLKSSRAYIKQYQGDKNEAFAYLHNAIHLSDSSGYKHLYLIMLSQLQNFYEIYGMDEDEKLVANKINILRDSFLLQQHNTERELSKKIFDLEAEADENKELALTLRKTKRELLIRNIIIGLIFASLTLISFLFLKFKKERKVKFPKHLDPEGFGEEDHSKNYQNNALLTHEELMLLIENWMNNDKPYLNPNMKIKDLEELLGLPYNKLNEVFRESEYKLFKRFVNHYRIKYAKEMLENPDFGHFKIEFIALESGFGTRQAFYKAFELEMGMTPSEYKDNLIKSDEGE